MTKVPPPSVINKATSRKYWAVACIIFTLIGIQLIKRQISHLFLDSFHTIFESWNKTFYLALQNPTDVLVGLLIILLGIIFFGRIFVPKNNLPPKIQELNGDWLRWRSTLPWVLACLLGYTIILNQLSQHRSSQFLILVWGIILVIITLLFWKVERKPSAPISHVDSMWVIALFAFAVAFTSYLLNDIPAGWIADELPFWKLAREIALGIEKPFFFDVGIFTFPVASSYLQAWIMYWTGIDFWGWRFASVLPATATIFPLYFLTHELFDRRTAIVASVLMFVNPYFLAFARLGYNNSQSLFPVTLCIYFLTIGIKRNDLFYLWLAGVTAGLGFYTYSAAWLGVVVLVLILLYRSLSLRGKFWIKLIPLGIVTAGTLFVILPRIAYVASGDSATSLSHKIWETGPINTFYGRFVFGDERIDQTNIFKINDIEVFYDPTLYGIILLRGIIRTAAILFDPIGYNDHQIFIGLTGSSISSLLFVLGLGVSLFNYRRIQYLTSSVWFLAGFFFLGVIASIPPRPTHMVAIIPVLALISAIGLISLLDIFTNNIVISHKSNIAIKNYCTAGMLFVATLMGYFQYFVIMPYIVAPPNQDDYISWLGRQIPVPANFILVEHYGTNRNPKDETLGNLTPHNVISLTQEDLEIKLFQIKNWNNFVAFFSLQNSKKYVEQIADQIPNSIIKMGYAPSQRLRGYIVTDMEINTSMDVSFSKGINDLWNSPVRSIVLACGLVILALLFREWRAKEKTLNKINGDQ